MRQEQPRLDPADGVFDQRSRIPALFVRDRGPQVLDFNRALADEDHLGDVIDPGHPGIANQLRIQCCNAVRLLRIAGGAGLPLQHTGRAVQFADGIDEGDKAVAGTQRPREPDLLMVRGWRIWTRPSWTKRSSNWMPCWSMWSQVSFPE